MYLSLRQFIDPMPKIIFLTGFVLAASFDISSKC
ncbi:hypothetical protein FHX64_000691 [Microbacter margulisiae]|uniref:Uncharacterized protein n=1 Tax=Microbacter margulisiae TaxID=1350067 RepID=A0A7W5H0G4_9PORP|nr:hypothetical protein [Microbacter margulisiae]